MLMTLGGEFGAVGIMLEEGSWLVDEVVGSITWCDEDILLAREDVGWIWSFEEGGFINDVKNLITWSDDENEVDDFIVSSVDISWLVNDVIKGWITWSDEDIWSMDGSMISEDVIWLGSEDEGLMK